MPQEVYLISYGNFDYKFYLLRESNIQYFESFSQIFFPLFLISDENLYFLKYKAQNEQESLLLFSVKTSLLRMSGSEQIHLFTDPFNKRSFFGHL